MTLLTINGINVPARATLVRYGMSLDDWKDVMDRQGWTCGVCNRVPPTGRTVVDHEHVRGWKKMLPEERKKYVRGVCCTTCNHWILTRYADAQKHRAAADYLEAYGARQ